MMTEAFPDLSKYFGLLTGFAFTIPFAFGGLFWGRLSNKLNKKCTVGILMLL